MTVNDVIMVARHNDINPYEAVMSTLRAAPSLCTTVALQWEPQIIAVAVMYLAGRLSKLDIQDWTSKPLSRRWWEQFVHDVPVEVLEGEGNYHTIHSTSNIDINN